MNIGKLETKSADFVWHKIPVMSFPEFWMKREKNQLVLKMQFEFDNKFDDLMKRISDWSVNSAMIKKIDVCVSVARDQCC